MGIGFSKEIIIEIGMFSLRCRTAGKRLLMLPVFLAYKSFKKHSMYSTCLYYIIIQFFVVGHNCHSDKVCALHTRSGPFYLVCNFLNRCVFLCFAYCRYSKKHYKKENKLFHICKIFLQIYSFYPPHLLIIVKEL